MFDQLGAVGVAGFLEKQTSAEILTKAIREVAAGRSLIRRGEDLEGFSAGSRQFDSDITDGRHPRGEVHHHRRGPRCGRRRTGWRAGSSRRSRP